MSATRLPSPLSLPAADEVDLWTADLVAAGEDLQRAAAVLTDGERERFRRVIRPAHRDRLIVARATLRRVLGGYLEVPPDAVTFALSPHGKPRLDPDPGLSFNLSHSGAVAVVAVTTRPAVGVDVELLGRRIGPGVLARALSPAERERVLALAPALRDEAFLRHWTAKEAYAKAVGLGLTVGLHSVQIEGALGSVGLHSVQIEDATGTPTLADPDARRRFSLQRFDPHPGAVGAVAVAGGPWHARRRDPG